MSKLYIAEKPDVAKAIVDALTVKATREDGYFLCSNGDKVTWCYGHMLQLWAPEDYDEKYAKWQLEHLPIVNIPWYKKPIKDSKKQLYIINDLLKNATEIIHAGDPDDEGQLLVDEILDYFKCNLPVKRLLINDNNKNVIQKSLSKMRDNNDYKGLSQAAEARSVADQLYGFNITRAYTLVGQKQGHQGVLSVGRVQTPILGLVVRRDRENKSHQKNYYYNVYGNFNISNIEFQASYITQKDDGVDEKGRLINKSIAENIAKECERKPAKILAAKISNEEEAPPLPYNLLKLQAECSKKLNLTPSEVKEITQNLREKYKLITYNRSDCQYINEENHSDAPRILETIKYNLPQFTSALNKADTKIKSRAFNSDRVSAHHAIIPTEAKVDINLLSKQELDVYLLIARAYIAQFYPNHEFDQTDLIIQVDKRQFECRNNITTNPGWLVLYKNDSDNIDEQIDKLDLRPIKQDMIGICVQAISKEYETKPRPLYTMETLLNDLTRVAKYIQNEKLKNILIEKDKNKQGEHGGIGTPATRDEIIRNLFDKGFLCQKGKNIISTEIGQQLYDSLPDIAKYPDMTALWHEQQQLIIRGQLSSGEFIKNLVTFITQEIKRVKENGIGIVKAKYSCPKCGKSLRRIKGQKGFFWGCTGYKDGCTSSFSDKAGRPVLRPQKTELSQKFFCVKCHKALIRRQGKEKGSHFWGCSNYPNCKQFYQDVDGKPLIVNDN